MVRAIRGLLDRNPNVDHSAIDDVAIAAATQTGDQGMNIGRSATLLAGLPNTVPGYSIDRWCAGALTAVTTIAGDCFWFKRYCYCRRRGTYGKSSNG